MEDPIITIKLSKTELETMIKSLEFLSTMNVPIENDWLKPYYTLQRDLELINKKVDDQIRNRELG